MLTETQLEDRQVVSPEEWLAARMDLLAKEKAVTQLRDSLAEDRRKLPWVRVTKEYKFQGARGTETLADLFGGKSQLMIYHFMLGPGWEAGCPSCSVVGDHIHASAVHLAARDVRLLAVSRAPLPEIEAFRRRMGWKFTWLSSGGSDFNYDYHVSFHRKAQDGAPVYYNYGERAFPKDEAPGLSVFYKDAAGSVFHTYSCYARGLEPLMGVYNYLDLAPKGRDEEGLPWPMAWVRHHDKYEQTPAPAGHCCQEASR